MVGFKSFKDRTVIQFDRGVTGIVGPNGCGKSNIIDAFLWVMGEMSAKHLRGGVMEDVIFSGAQGYAPSGFAEVSIVLENEGQSFPAQWAQHSEMMVTRRLHRSGESEYLMNKQACRLRDVQEFFMDTGAGRRGFSIVAQEAISRLVLAKPEERRVFIEEAAGISKFKLRQKESQRKLAATDANLLRLNDILSEQKRQLSSLQRQAKKAEKYRQVKSELQQKDMWLMSMDFLDLQRQRSSTGQAVQDAQTQGQALEAQLAGHETNVQRSKLELSEKESTLQQQQLRSAQANERVRECEKQVRECEFQIQQSQDAQATATQIIKQNEEKKSKTLNDMQQLKSEKKQLDAQIQQTQSQTLEQQKSFEDLKDQIYELEQGQQTQQAERTALLQKQSETRSLNDHTEQQLAEARQQEAQLASELKELTKKTKHLKRELQKLETQLASERQYQLDLSESAEKSKSSLSELQLDIRTRTQEVAQLKDAFHQAASRLEGLEKLQANFEGLQEGAKNIMLWQKSEATTVDGGVTREAQLLSLAPSEPTDFKALADIVEVPALYELAAEAFLGPRLQSLLTDKPQQALEALKALKHDKLGRSSFVLPAGGEAKPEALARPSTAEGVRAVLAEVVQAQPEYRERVQALLKDVFVVDSLEQAVQLQGRYPSCSFVSLEGEGVFSDALMVGGTAGSADSGALRRRREVRELKLQKTELEGKLALAQAALQKQQDQEDALSLTHESHQHTAHKKELLVAGLEKDVDFEQAQLQKHTDLCDKTNTQLKQAGELVQSLQQQLGELQKLQLKVEADKSTLEEKLRQLSEQHNQLKGQQDTQQHDLTSIQVQHASLKEKHEALYLQIKLLEEQLADQLQQIEAAQSTLSQSEQVFSQSTQQHKEQKTKLEKFISEAEAEERVSSSLANEVQQTLEQCRQLDAEVAEHLRRIGDHKSTVSQVQSQAEKIDIKVDHLLQQATEKYMSSLKDEAQKYIDVEVVDTELEATRLQVQELSDKLSRMGGVHLGAVEEHDELLKRHEFLTTQCEDLNQSKQELVRVIEKIRRTYSKRFKQTFELVNERFAKVFVNLFGGGQANLIMIENEEKKELGIDIMAQPPGKKLQSISLLSGGEKALTAVALIFSIFLVNPSPFCLLDEVDAPLDDANVDRFNELVKQMSKLAQIIVVTHNKNTMRVNNKLFGVTMQERGVSKLVSVSLGGT